MKHLLTLLGLFLTLSIHAQQIECIGESPDNPLNTQSIPDASARAMTTCSLDELSIEEWAAMPTVTFDLAFHFFALSNGDNFTCDPNDPIINSNNSPQIFAPLYMQNILDQMNARMANGLLTDDGQTHDTKIRFRFVGPDACSSASFYSANETVSLNSNAMNIIMNNNGNTTIHGYTFWNANRVYILNTLQYYLNISNPPNTHDIARLINHEFLHTRSLNHTHYCNNPCNGISFELVNGQNVECCGTCYNHNGPAACWGCNDRQLVMGPGSQLYLTPCELKEAWNYILETSPSYQTYCEGQASTGPVIYDVNGIVVWSGKRVFNTDVRIKSGTTVEVLCEVLMGADKRIIVENGGRLIVNGGTITSLCDNGLWGGIKVTGGNSDFDVKIYNQSTIENTKDAAVSMFPALPYNQAVNFGNGILEAQNSTFNNCKRIAELISFTPQWNSSRIVGCTQNGGVWGVTNWNCQDVLVEGNTFNDLSDICVTTIGGSYRLFDNLFNGGRGNLILNNASAVSPTFVENNTFLGREFGVRSVGTSITESTILNNQFNCTEVDVLLEGDNDFRIENNNFNAIIGVVASGTGVHANPIHANSFQGNAEGIVAVGYNRGLNFTYNCFNSSVADVYVDGTIRRRIRYNTKPAGNCFSHQGNASSTVFDIAGNMNNLRYYEPGDLNPTCHDAVKAPIQVQRVLNGTLNNIGCGSDGLTPTPPNFPDDFDPCNPGQDPQDIMNAITWLEQELIVLNSGGDVSTYTQDVYDHLIQLYTRCLQNLSGNLFMTHIRSGDFEKARSLYESKTDEISEIAVFTSYIFENDTKSARAFLKQTKSESVEFDDFKTIQYINLERIAGGYFYEASPRQLKMVKEIAIKEHPYAAYAKGLYYIFTKELISTDKTRLFEKAEDIPKVKMDNSIIAKVYPNPFSTELNLQVEGAKGADVFIMDQLGREIYQGKMDDDNLSLSTRKWSTGLVIISISKNGKAIHQGKYMHIEDK